MSTQKEASVAYLGPAGSYSHTVASKRFGEGVLYVPQATIEDVFRTVEGGGTTYGIIPIENSTFGSVVTTLDCFVSSKVQVHAETYLKVSHCLLSNSKLESLKRVYSHPQALGQCKGWLDTHLKDVPRVETFSSSKAAELAATETHSAAICNLMCSDLYKLNVLERDIQDKKDNVTRFFILGEIPSKSTKDHKTLLLFTVDHQKPSALCDSLKVFKDHNINITKIDSRPSLQRPWHYVFFIEFLGHKDDEPVKNSLKELKKFCSELKVIGSYPNQQLNDINN